MNGTARMPRPRTPNARKSHQAKSKDGKAKDAKAKSTPKRPVGHQIQVPTRPTASLTDTPQTR